VTHQTPSSFPQVYSGHQITIFALICGDFNEQARVSLEGKIAGQSSTDEEMLQIDCLLSEFKSVQGNTMHKFGIGCLIKELEHDSSQQANIVELSLKYSILSKFTAFVAIECNEKAVEGSMVQHMIALRSARKHDEQGQFVTIKGRRLRLLDANVSKAGKHGSAKAHIVVIDPDTGKKMEHIMPSSEFKKIVETHGPQPRKTEGHLPNRKETDREKLREIIMLQSAAGYWTLTDLQTLIPQMKRDACLHWARQEITNEQEPKDDPEYRLCATLLIVTYLTYAFPEWESHWGMVVEKAWEACAFNQADRAAYKTKTKDFLAQSGLIGVELLQK